MQAILSLSKRIDKINEVVFEVSKWFVFVMVLLSAGNATTRKFLNLASNASLEGQWYLFSAVFLLSGAYVLRQNEHIRVDVLFSHYSPRTRAIVDCLGVLVFLAPLCYLMVVLGWDFLKMAWVTQEDSNNVGGLIRWPVKSLIFIGFILLSLQALSEFIKLLAFLNGQGPDPNSKFLKDHH